MGKIIDLSDFAAPIIDNRAELETEVAAMCIEISSGTDTDLFALLQNMGTILESAYQIGRNEAISTLDHHFIKNNIDIPNPPNM